MEWLFDEEKSVWNLMDNTSVTARIFIREKPDNRRKFHTKALVASIYFGSKTFSRLTRKNKEWKVYTRKFYTKDEMENYLHVKKAAIKRTLEKI